MVLGKQKNRPASWRGARRSQMNR